MFFDTYSKEHAKTLPGSDNPSRGTALEAKVPLGRADPGPHCESLTHPTPLLSRTWPVVGSDKRFQSPGAD